MANGDVPEEISNAEVLARFVVSRRWVRQDNTVKSDAFIPYPYPDLSVTRHIGLSEDELWVVGQGVAAGRSLSLHGRADTHTSIIKGQGLSVHPAPLAENANHANVKGWPKDKSEQKIKALEIAKTAVYSRYIS